MSFILLTPKWSWIKDPEEIQKRSNNSSSASAFATSAHAQLSNHNCPKALLKGSPLSPVQNAKDELSDSESIVGSKVEAEYELDKKINLFFEVFATDAD